MPTDDIHMNQAGFEDEWLTFLRNYVKPFVEAAYPGYYSKVSWSLGFGEKNRPPMEEYQDKVLY